MLAIAHRCGRDSKDRGEIGVKRCSGGRHGKPLQMRLEIRVAMERFSLVYMYSHVYTATSTFSRIVPGYAVHKINKQTNEWLLCSSNDTRFA